MQRSSAHATAKCNLLAMLWTPNSDSRPIRSNSPISELPPALSFFLISSQSRECSAYFSKRAKLDRTVRNFVPVLVRESLERERPKDYVYSFLGKISLHEEISFLQK